MSGLQNLPDFGGYSYCAVLYIPGVCSCRYFQGIAIEYWLPVHSICCAAMLIYSLRLLRPSGLRLCCAIPLLLFFLVFAREARADICRDYTVQASIKIESQPFRFVLSWPGHREAVRYEVYRKSADDTKWGERIYALPGNATEFSDVDIDSGRAYEYRIVCYAMRDTFPYKGYGYLYAGIGVPATEYRGKIILLVEKSIEARLVSEIARLENDLRGDGWLVVRRNVERSDTPPAVKKIISDIYYADTKNVKAVFLLGHVPVPYSGDYNPDGHPDHVGAWPADGYYADMNGIWTDITVNDTMSSVRIENFNIPGDGKFDHDVLPSNVELMIGRVDLYNLKMFTVDEVALLKRYLDKNHIYRHSEAPVVQRGLIDDNFKGEPEAFASNGWRNFAPMFGAAKVDTGEFIRGYSPAGKVALTDSFYVWSYGCGAGNFISAAFVAHGSQFAADTVTMKTVFTMLFGSYFGDWDSPDNFMRMALASKGYILTSCWAGRPFWHLHHMALGETIGYATRLSQNNDTLYLSNPAYPAMARSVHTALMGDPTLRLHTVPPPGNLLARRETGTHTVYLRWGYSSLGAVQGYYVYRATSPDEPFQRLNDEPLTTNTFADATAAFPDSTWSSVRYMVRAVRLETSASGSYYNLSQGKEAIVEVGTLPTGVPIGSGVPASGAIAVYPNPVRGECTVEIAGAGVGAVSVELYDVSGRCVLKTEQAATGGSTKVRIDTGGFAPGVYVVRVHKNGELFERQIVVQ